MSDVLVVDDDPAIRKLVRVNLEKRGYTVRVAADGTKAIDAIKHQLPDLVLLDIVMPGLSGIDVCLWIRTQSDVPIIVLSAHDEEDLMIRALDAGADDYVTKPFSYEALLARVRAVMRRAAGSQDGADRQIKVGDLLIDLDARRVLIGGVDLQFTRTEFALLAELAKNPETVLKHGELLARVWGPEYHDESHYLYIYFGRIRSKLGSKYADLLETVPGIGYLFRTSL
ncbi:MAG: response regulator transcription factor [Anaerolineae bacterium]|nr:response regulator transcription factor [Anaerolineae bacterium]